MISFSAAISACEKGWQWVRAVSLLDKTCKAGMSANVISFNAAISERTAFHFCPEPGSFWWLPICRALQDMITRPSPSYYGGLAADGFRKCRFSGDSASGITAAPLVSGESASGTTAAPIASLECVSSSTHHRPSPSYYGGWAADWW